MKKKPKPCGNRRKICYQGIFSMWKRPIVMACFLVFSFSFALQAQQQRVSLQLEDKPLADAINELKKQTKLDFFYSNAELDTQRKITLKTENTAISEVLSQLLGKEFTVEFMDNMVIIRPQSKPTEQVVIVGVVRDKSGNPIPGATVLIKGSKLGVATDAQGNFRLLTSPDPDMVLLVSFIGMETQEVKYSGQSLLTIVLKEMSAAVDEVVVTGIFERKAGSFTGTARTFSRDELQRVGNTNVFQSLKNLDASLWISDNMAMGSNPNTLPDIKLNGTSTFSATEDTYSLKSNFTDAPNTPLFILDGFETQMEKIFDMDMNRIESLTILKDAAAKAMYGSKAANGVIVIETKRLRDDEVRVTYTGDVRLEMPDLSSYDLTNAMEKLYVEDLEGYYNNSTIENHLKYQEIYNRRLARAKEGVDTYWLSKPLHTGVGQTHSLGIELGEKNLKAYATVRYSNVEGVMKESLRRVISGDMNISYRYKNLTFRNIMSVSGEKEKDSPYGTFDQYARLNPYWEPYDKEGNLVQYLDDTDLNNGKVANPLYDATLDVLSTQDYFEFSNNFYTEYDFLNYYKVVARFGLTVKKTAAEEFYPSKHSRFSSLINSSVDDDYLRAGSYDAMNGKMNTLSGDLRLQYNRSIGSHDLFGTVQYNFSESKYSEVTHYTEGFPSDRMDNIVFARQYAKDATPTGTDNLSRSVGILGYLSYIYDNRYGIDGTLRADAASMFGKDNRWALLWSVGLTWNLHRESFLSSADWIESLRLKGSFGYTGNQNFQGNQSNALYQYVTTRYYQHFVGAQLSNMENPSLSWEKKKEYSLSLDGRMGNANFQIRYYLYDTENMAFTRTIVPSTGFSTVRDNLGKVRNKGIEVDLQYIVWRSNQGFLTLRGNIMTNDNRILKISSDLQAYNDRQKQIASYLNHSTPVALYENGQAMNTIWAVPSLGIDPATGKEIFLDQNNNKTTVWSSSNLRAFGSSDPKYNGLFAVNGEYKGFGLSATVTFLGGGKYYNQTLVNKVENVDIGYNVDRRVFTGRWQTPGQEAQFRKLGTGSQVYDELQEESVMERTRATSRFVQKRNELTFSQVSVYYLFDSRLIERIGLKQLKLSSHMNNIGTLSTIKIERGTSYPFARTLNFSITGTF